MASHNPNAPASVPWPPFDSLEGPGLALRLWPGWVQGQGLSSDALRSHLRDDLPWDQPRVKVFGRVHPVPRLTCWIGDLGCVYRYSGLLQTPQPWTPPLLDLRERLESGLGVRFNSLLLNRYRSGADRMGWHADDEPELVADHPIASLSLGASRSLRFRPRPQRAGAGSPPRSVPLNDGDLLVMEAPTQRHWQHALPERRRLGAERINLTFRCIQLG
jgi:alkylated DNA repair dioxygenase AlkB